MANIAKFKKQKKSASGGLVLVGKTEKISGPASMIVEYGSHAVLSLATREMGAVHVPILNRDVTPDVLGLAAAATAYAFGGKKTKKLATTVARGAVHAVEGRMIWGSDRMRELKLEKQEEPPVSVSGLDEKIANAVAAAVSAAFAKVAKPTDSESEEEAA